MYSCTSLLRFIATTAKDGCLLFWKWDPVTLKFQLERERERGREGEREGGERERENSMYISTCKLLLLLLLFFSDKPIKFMEKNRVSDQTLCSAFSPGKSQTPYY